ncbi:MAG: hypothetical protein IKE91_06435 [Clostridia bacterium]|nr:hypothetical protein [Clostridia bacterium]
MNENKYEFFIAGKFRNKDVIMDICDVFDKRNISNYCFLRNEVDYADKDLSQEEKQKVFEGLDLNSEPVVKIFESDMEAEKASDNFLLVLPAGKSGHIEAGVAYGMGKKCYAIGEYEGTDSLYHVFDRIFKDKEELEKFLSEEYKKQ